MEPLLKDLHWLRSTHRSCTINSLCLCCTKCLWSSKTITAEPLLIKDTSEIRTCTSVLRTLCCVLHMLSFLINVHLPLKMRTPLYTGHFTSLVPKVFSLEGFRCTIVEPLLKDTPEIIIIYSCSCHSAYAIELVRSPVRGQEQMFHHHDHHNNLYNLIFLQ